MINIKHEVSKDGKKLTIEVDLTQEHGLSTSGKTTIVASTQGNAQTGVKGIQFGLNVFKKPEAK